MDSFKVKKEKYINKTVRIPTERLEKLKIIAKHHKMPCTALIEQCIEFALQNIPENEKKDSAQQ